MLLNIIALGILLLPFVAIWGIMSGIIENTKDPNRVLVLQLVRFLLVVTLGVYYYFRVI